MPASDLVLLDRDGVINYDSDDYVKSPDEWIPVPASIAAIGRLGAAGIGVIVVTNQSGIGRGLFCERVLAEIHARMRQAIEDGGGRLEGVYHCPHAPGDACDCRKPRPGLLKRIEHDLGRTLAGVPVIGDKTSDCEAAVAAGARPILIGSERLDGFVPPAADTKFESYRDLGMAVDALLDA